MMIGARDLAFPRLNLASWYLFMGGGVFTLWALLDRRRRYRLDILHAVQQHVRQYARDADRGRRFHHRLLDDSHRAELYRHRAHDASPGHDLVSLAAVCLVELRQ